jgi:hypothetical protein
MVYLRILKQSEAVLLTLQAVKEGKRPSNRLQEVHWLLQLGMEGPERFAESHLRLTKCEET